MSALYALLGLFAIVGGGFAIYAIWRGGRASAQLDQAESTIDAARTRGKVDEGLRGASDDDLRGRLRKPPS